MLLQKLLFIFGTRPEAIKMAPLIKAFETESCFEVRVCVTAQHRQMLDQVLHFFSIKPDFDLDLMQPNQSLFQVTANALTKLEKVLGEYEPDVIFVQGDTTSAFVGALAGFYKKVKVAHIEAGLRSSNKYSPFPEEINRILTGHIADYHFAPTLQAVENLKVENIKSNIYQVGNTVIDALLLGLNLIQEKGEEKYRQHFNFIDFNKKVILVTGHRRESFGEPFENICEGIKEIVTNNSDVQVIYPVHLNPNVQDPVIRILKDAPNVFLIDPLEYPYLIWLMNHSYLVLTDSGGIQEEAPSLGKPVLVMRDVTERMEGVVSGTAMLIGTNKDRIIKEVNKLLKDKEHYQRMANAVNPYGDGTSCKKIVEIVKQLA